MATNRLWPALALFMALMLVITSPQPLQAQIVRLQWGSWAVIPDQTDPPSSKAMGDVGPREHALVSPNNDEDAVEEWVFTYDLWQWGISSLSGLGPISPIQGRREVLAHAKEIKRWAPDDLELLVAASISAAEHHLPRRHAQHGGSLLRRRRGLAPDVGGR